MLQFSSDPPLDSTRYALRLIRTPARGKLKLIVTSDDLLGCWTHFFAGRTTPCTGATCEACRGGASSRWHGYVSVLEPGAREHLIFECTAAAATSFANYRIKHGTLRGCDFIADRTSARPNARVRLRMTPADLAAIDLPEGANLTAVLCHIWGIPQNETQTISGPQNSPEIEHRGTLPPPDRGNGDQVDETILSPRQQR